MCAARSLWKKAGPLLQNRGTRFKTSTMSSTTRPADLESQTFRLPDGRILGFAEYGPSSGSPLLYFHGFPSSRLEAKNLTKLAIRHNIRILSIDRPGYGLSTFQPKRSMLDWPDDVKAVTSHLGIPKFSILAGM